MDIQLAPNPVKILLKFLLRSSLEGTRPPVPGILKTDVVHGLYLTRPFGHNDYPIGHTHGFGNIMRDQNDRLAFAPENFGNLVRKRETRLKVQRGKRFVQ